MQFLLDNLMATLIAASLFLILVTVNHRTSEAAIEANIYYAMKRHEYNFIDFIKHDFRSMREVRSTNEAAHHGGNDSTFAFIAEVRDSPTASRRIAEVQYRYGFTRSRDGQKLFQVERWVDDGTGTMKQAGASTGTLTGWEVQALNSNKQEITNPAQLDLAAAVRVRIEVAPPFLHKEMRQALPRSRWKTTFWPRFMQGLAV